MTALDELLPAYDVHEVHRLWVPAPLERTWRASREITVGEIRLFGPLMLLRSLPALVQRRAMPLPPERGGTRVTTETRVAAPTRRAAAGSVSTGSRSALAAG